MNKNLYEVLGVSKNASIEEIKKAYKKMALQYHPDMHADKSDEEKAIYEEKFKELNNAHEILSNEVTRAEYDRQLAREKANASSQSSNNRNSYNSNSEYSYNTNTNERSQRREETTTSDEDDWDSVKVDFSEIFKHFIYKTKEEYKNAWKDIKAEEKQDSFIKRHKEVDEVIREDYYPKSDKISSKIGYELLYGTLHIFSEVIHELYKLSTITKESIPKFVVRNRRVLSTVAAIAIFATGAGMSTDQPIDQPQTDPSGITQPYDDDINEKVTIYRKYEIQFGDTLTKLAEDANTTPYDIASYNGFSVNDIIVQGTDITIPYRYNEEDVEYATDSIPCDIGTHISVLAKQFETTPDSLRTLNGKDVFDEYGNFIGEEIIAPHFPTRAEFEEAKAGSKANSYGR